MTKAEIVAQISRQSGIEKTVVMTVIESFMENVKESMVAGNEVFLRGFGSFIIKRRAEKTARNISKNTTIKIPAHNIPAFKAYMEWYTLYDQLVPVIGDRAISLFSHAISEGNECLICSIFFRKILIDSGDDPDNPHLSDTEKLLVDFGGAICKDPHNIPDEIYNKLSERFSTEEIVLLIAFAGIMYATNLFNTVAKVPLDEVLYKYRKDGDTRNV